MSDIVERARSYARNLGSANLVWRLADEIERLQTGWDLATKAIDTNESLRTQLAEAAAFLDALAGHLEQDRWLVEITAADCHAMAKKLRALEGK